MTGMNGMNGLNAAALALQALAATNPTLLMSQNPWLAGHMQMLAGLNPMAPGQPQHLQGLGQMPATGPMPIPPVDPAQLAAAQQLGQQLNGAGGCWPCCEIGWGQRCRYLQLVPALLLSWPGCGQHLHVT